MIALGAIVRLVKVVGAASDSLRAERGKVGTVRAVRDRAGSTVLQVAFADGEVFWLRADEVELAEPIGGSGAG